MQLIPVIDLMGGVAVDAKQGIRRNYQPLQTRLCSDSNPLTVAEALLSLSPFKDLYVADLDALMQRGNNFSVIQQLISTFPKINFWIDQGTKNLMKRSSSEIRWDVVIGSESVDISALRNLKEQLRGQFILSLDHTEHGLIGPRALIQDPSHWPDRVIIMSLNHVGNPVGPDWSRIEYFMHRWPKQRFIVGGGVRDEKDIVRLTRLGVEAALAASALHTGTLCSSALARLQ